MARFWIGVGLLVGFLGLGLWVSKAMDEVHVPVMELLEQAADATLEGDMESGKELADRAYAVWERYWRGTAAVADHAPMDEIDGLFALVQGYARAGSAADFAAGCGRLSKLVEAIGEAHSPKWWNLL